MLLQKKFFPLLITLAASAVISQWASTYKHSDVEGRNIKQLDVFVIYSTQREYDVNNILIA